MSEQTTKKEHEQIDAELVTNREESLFVRSLDSITGDELGKKPEKAVLSRSEKQYLLFRRIAAVVAVLAFLAALGYFIYKIVSYREAAAIYNSLEDTFFNGNDMEIPPDHGSPLLSAMVGGKSGVVGTEITQRDYSKEAMMVQLKRLQAKNADVFGWIRISGESDVSYPLIDASSNEYYLFHAYDNSYNPTGSIFLDQNCYQNLDANANSVIWGHNMLFGTPMFHSLLKYKDAYYWRAHRYIFVYTAEKTYRYEIFSAYQADPTIYGVGYFTTDLGVWEDKNKFVSDAIAASAIGEAPEITPTADNMIMTLCTCDEDGEKRFVVHARRMSDYELIDGEDNIDDEAST